MTAPVDPDTPVRLRDVPRRGQWLLGCVVIDAAGYIIGWTILTILVTLRFGLQAGATLTAAQLLGSALATPLAYALSRALGSRNVLRLCAGMAVLLRGATFVLLDYEAPLWALVSVSVVMAAFAWAARAAHKAEISGFAPASAVLLLTYFGLAVAVTEAGGSALAALLPGLDSGELSTAALTLVGVIYALSQLPLVLVGRSAGLQAPRLAPGQGRALTTTLLSKAWLPCLVILLAAGPTLVRVAITTVEAGPGYVAAGACAMLVGALLAPAAARRLPRPDTTPALEPLLGVAMLLPWALAFAGGPGLVAAHLVAGCVLTVFKARLDVILAAAVPDSQRVVALAASVSSRDLTSAVAAVAAPAAFALLTLEGWQQLPNCLRIPLQSSPLHT